MAQSLPRSTPESQGISSSAILSFLNRAENIKDFHSFMLVLHGQVVAEGCWYPYQADIPHMLYSLSKSFTSTAVGFAVSEGLLSVDDTVLKFFPEDAPDDVSVNLAAMKVRHLLSMSTGHDEDSTDATMRGENPFKSFLSLPVDHEPGTHFVYNSGASYMLAAIVQKLTGQTLVKYLMPRLFQPLGIDEPAWDSHPNGVNFGGWGLYLKTEDIAKFGQLLLQKGAWNGKQIIPKTWVEEATRKHVDNGDDPNNDWNQGYGYQFWRCRYNCYRGDGAFGQYCIVLPDQDAVVAITSGVSDMQAVMNIVWEQLLVRMGSKAIQENTQDVQALAVKLTSLNIEAPSVTDTSPWAITASEKKYIFEPNQDKLHSVRFDFATNTFSYRFLIDGKQGQKHVLQFGNGEWVKGNASFATNPIAPEESIPVASSGTWTSEDTFALTICQTGTPHILTLICQFENGKFHYQRKINVAFGPTESEKITGKLVEYLPER